MQDTRLIESYPAEDSESEPLSAKSLKKRAQYEQMNISEALIVLLERQSKTHKLCKEISRRTDALEQQLLESHARIEQLHADQTNRAQKQLLQSEPSSEEDSDTDREEQSENCFFQPLIALVAACRRRSSVFGGRKRSNYTEMERGEYQQQASNESDTVVQALTMVKED